MDRVIIFEWIENSHVKQKKKNLKQFTKKKQQIQLSPQFIFSSYSFYSGWKDPLLSHSNQFEPFEQFKF